jgi:F0F1-type ATP synthase epsilon subunit
VVTPKNDGINEPKNEGTTLASVLGISHDKRMTMHIKIYSPYRVYFDNLAYSISGENGTGPFDVLPHHHPFISLLDACELVVDAVETGKIRIKVSGGIMHVKADKVSVFLQV